eukprot:COSAG02_NODE_1092_length_14622_cov_95.061971_13_plen_2227_part_00
MEEEEGLVHVATMEELLARAELMAADSGESAELPHVLQALRELGSERKLAPEADAAYYKFCVRLAAEPTPRVGFHGCLAGSWRERLQAVNARHLRRQAASAQRRRYLAGLALAGWRRAARSASPVWSASMAGASPTVETPGLAEPDVSRISHPAPIHGLWDKPEPRWSLTEADDQLARTHSSSLTTESPPSRVPAQDRESRAGESPQPVRGELALSPPRPDWDAALLCGCFRKWAIQTDESRRMQLEFSHAVAQFEEEADRWREYVLRRAFRLWRLSIRMQIAAAYAAETVYRYCWRRWTLLVRITLAELHREDVLLCACLTAFRRVCVAIAHERRYQARATLMRLSLAAAQGQQKRLACAYWRQHGLNERWRRWVDFTRMSCRKRQATILAEAQVVRWLQRHLSRWLYRWASYASETASARIRRATAVQHFRRVTLKTCCQKWFRYLQIRKHKLRRVAQVLIVLSSRILGTAMSRWRLTTELARKLRHAALRFSHRVVLWAWDVWVERARWWKQMDLISALAGNHSRMIGARSAFCVWRDNVAKYQLVDHKLKIAVARLLNSTVGSAFAAWADSTKKITDQRNRLERVISLFMNRVLHAAFRGWEASAVEKRSNRETMLRVVKMFQNVCLGGAFQGWYTRAHTKITNREKLTRAIKVLQNSRVISAFNAWRARAEFKVHSRKKVARAVHLMLNSLLHSAFAGWYDKISAKVANQAMLRKAVLVMTNALVLSAFKGWHTNATVKLENRAKLTKVIAVMGNFALSSAWGGWCEYVDVRTSNRGKVNRVLGRIHNSLIGKAFERWATYTDAVFEAREQLHNAVLRCDKCVCVTRVVAEWLRATRRLARRRRKREHERVKYVIYRKVLGHMRGAVKRRQFTTWVAYVTDVVRTRAVQTKCINFYMHRTISSAFSQWVFALSEIMHNRDKLERFLSILFNRSLRSAFNGWKSNALEKATNREKMMRVVKMIQSQTVASAFISWHETVQSILDVRRVMAAVVMALSNRKMKSALHTWSHLTTERIGQREIMFKAASLIANYRTAAAFKGWCARCTERIEQRGKVGRAVQHILQRALACAFNGWMENARQMVKSKNTMMAVIRTFTRKGLAAAVGRWVEVTSERAEMRALLARTICAMQSFQLRAYFNLWTESLRGDQSLRYLLNRNMARAFVSWSNMVQEQKENMARVHRSLRKITNRALASAMHSWASAVSVTKSNRRNLAAVLQRFRNRALASAMHSWASAVSIAKSNRRKLAAVLQRFRNRALATALHSWARTVDSAKSNREKVAAILQRFRGRAVLLAVSEWRNAVSIIRDRREMLLRIVERFRNRALSASFHSWQELTIERASKQEQLLRAIEILGGSRLRSAFSGWVATAQERVENRVKLQAVHNRMRSLAVAGAFATWSCYATEKAMIQSKLSAVLVRISKLALATSFNAWCTTAQRTLLVNGIVYDLAVKWRNGRTRQIFESWYVWVAHRNELSALQDAITRDREQKAKAGLMRGWSLLFVACCTYRLYMARMAIRTWVQNATSAKHTRILSRVMARLSIRTVSLCFDGWKDANSVFVRHQKVVQKVLSRINNRVVAASFSAWAECAIEQAAFGKWASLKAESFARQLLGDMLYSAFRTWREWNLRRERTRLIGARIEDHRAQTVKRQQMFMWRQRYAQSSTISRIRRQGVQTAWGHWTERVQKARNRREQIKAAAQRWRTCTTAGRFDHWHSTIVEAHRIRAAAQKIQKRQWWLRWRCHSKQSVLDRLNRAVNRILQRRVRMALGKWREFCTVRAQQRATIATAVKRMHQREIIAIFNQWGCFTRKQAGDNCAVAKAIHRLRGRMASSAFAAWASLAARSTHERHILSNAVNMLRLRAVRMTFMRWWAGTAHSIALRGLLRVWVGHRVAAMLGHYISVWHDALLVNRHRRWAADTIALATCARLAARAWGAWVLIHRCELVLQKSNARHARTVLHQWFSASQRCAERRWRLQVARERRVLSTLGLLLAAWRYHAIYSRRSREVVVASHLRRHRAQAAYCLSIWHHFVAYTVELRGALKLWLGRKVAVMLTASFRRWLEFCTRQVATEMSWVRAIDFASTRINAALDQCFFALRRHALERAERRQLRDIADDCCTRRQLKVCFESWRGHLAELALAARQDSLALGAIDSSLGDYLNASLGPSPMFAQEKIQPVTVATSVGQPTELDGSLWQSDSLTQLGRELEALASSFNTIGRPMMARAAAQ